MLSKEGWLPSRGVHRTPPAVQKSAVPGVEAVPVRISVSSRKFADRRRGGAGWGEGSAGNPLALRLAKPHAVCCSLRRVYSRISWRPLTPTPPQPAQSPRMSDSGLLSELGGAPLQRGTEAFALSDLVELHPDLGASGVERGQHVEAGANGVAKAGGVGAAVDP